jgi:shikimate dehydrogenase
MMGDAPSSWAITGTTEVVGVYGWPVAHSLSPPMQNAALRHLGLDMVYVAFAVPPDQIEGAVAAIRALGLLGVNVTIPHKHAVVAWLDELDETAEAIGAANTIHNDDGVLRGYNTDGPGLLRSLAEVGVTVAGKRVAILGAGGSATAVAMAIARSRAEAVAILNRTPQKAERLADMVCEKAGRSDVDALPIEGEEARRAVEAADIVVDCTSVGMHPNEDVPPAVAEAWLHAGQVVCDLTYNPRETVLLKAARRRGSTPVDGTGMLVHQGAIALEIWTGRAAPVETMRAALLGAL